MFDGAAPGQEKVLGNLIPQDQVEGQDHWNNNASASTTGLPPNISVNGQRYNYNTAAPNQPEPHYQQQQQQQQGQNQLKIQQYQQIHQQQQYDRMSSYENPQADPAYAASKSLNLFRC